MILLSLLLKVIGITLLMILTNSSSWWSVYHDELLYVLKGLAWLQVCQAIHDTLVVGHFGLNETMELVSRDYWWPQLWKFMKEFLGSCDVCARAKNPHHHPHGLFKPLLVPTSPCFSISMDFIMDLPRFKSFNSILMAVDHFMKMVCFIPYNKSITSKKIIKLFLDHVFCYHGLFEDIVYDCGL